MDSFRRGRGLYDDIPWGRGSMGPWDGKGPPPPSYEGGFPETGGAKDPKQREERNRTRMHVRVGKRFSKIKTA